MQGHLHYVSAIYTYRQFDAVLAETIIEQGRPGGYGYGGGPGYGAGPGYGGGMTNMEAGLLGGGAGFLGGLLIGEAID